ncbi:MAG: hypothetical protein ABI563_19915, partial [Specibacter sp.]
MAIDKSLVQPSPVISAIINSDDTGVLSIDAAEEAHTGATSTELRQSLMGRVIAEAAKHGRPVRVSTMDESGLSTLLCSPTGEVEVEDESPAEDAQPVEIPLAEVQDVPKTPVAPVPALVQPQGTPTASAVPVPEAPSGRRALREAGSFLAASNSIEPATAGFRGVLNSFGFSLAPSGEEMSEREDIALVSKHFAGTRTIAVV